MILQSVEAGNKVVIQYCHTASEAFNTLINRYGIKYIAPLAQLLSQLFAVQSMKISPVTLKHDLIVSLTLEIAAQELETAIPDVVQTVTLMRSLSQEYNTTIEILTKRDKFPNFFEVFQSVRTTETKLAEPDEHTLEVELANAVAGNYIRQKKNCWVCNGDHFKSRCPKWLSTLKGKEFKTSGLKWYEWQEIKKNKREQAHATGPIVRCPQVVKYSDSESESERSTYLCASSPSLTSKRIWGLDIIRSCHLTPFKDVFIGENLPSRVPIEVDNGTIVYSVGRADVRIYWKNSSAFKRTRSTIL